MNYPDEFVMTEDHIKLLRAMYVEREHSEYETGAPWIDPKRPYGNSDVQADVIELLGWGVPDEDYSDALREQAARLHQTTQFALQIVLSTGRFKSGLYRRPISYDTRTWIPAAEVTS